MTLLILECRIESLDEAESYPHDPEPVTGKRTYDESEIDILFHSPGELVLTDPQGRRTGFDPLTNTSYDEIPQGTYAYFHQEDAVTGYVDSRSNKRNLYYSTNYR